MFILHRPGWIDWPEGSPSTPLSGKSYAPLFPLPEGGGPFYLVGRLTKDISAITNHGEGSERVSPPILYIGSTVGINPTHHFDRSWQTNIYLHEADLWMKMNKNKPRSGSKRISPVTCLVGLFPFPFRVRVPVGQFIESVNVSRLVSMLGSKFYLLFLSRQCLVQNSIYYS